MASLLQPSTTSQGVPWEVTFWTHVPAASSSDDDVKDMGLQLTVISLDGKHVTFDNLDEEESSQPQAYTRSKQGLPGRTDSFKVQLPQDFQPAAIKIRDMEDRGCPLFCRGGKYERFFLKRVVLRPLIAGTVGEVRLLANSYISPVQGDRLFVRDDAWTDRALRANRVIQELQEEELAAMRGEGSNAAVAKKERLPGDRIYCFDTYNDLGSDPKDASNIRPTLGGKENPYPRRMATNRGHYKGTEYEVNAEKPGILEPLLGDGLLADVVGNFLGSPWVPEDDNFSQDKAAGFIGGAVVSQLPAAVRKLQGIFPPGKEFDSIADVLSLYQKSQLTDADDEATQGLSRDLAKAADTAEPRDVCSVQRDQADKSAVQADSSKVGLRSGFAGREPNTPETLQPIDLLKFDAPRSLTCISAPCSEVRLPTWHTDKEFGRMFLAGLNPMVIQAVSGPESLAALLPSEGPAKTAITDGPITALLEGHSFAELAAEAAAGKPRRLFVIDYWAIHNFLPGGPGALVPPAPDNTKDQDKEGSKVLHAARAVLFRRSDGYLVPVAIELTHRQDVAATVTTPNDPATLWLLAKLLFMSVDSGYHQLVSHFVRTHACVEPYLISMRRHMSPTHPMFRLMMPHFRYTMPINAAARGNLINAGGVIEQAFTPGANSMQLSSKVYGLTWQFKDEGLPADLKKRGFMDASGKLLVDDYPYAEDGLPIWNALHSYFTDYVNYYYKSDAEVAADQHLQAWWKDVKENGHPDISSGWLDPADKASLVEVAATIAWVASAHHAAVNFGQYDYSAWPLTHSSLCRKAMPARGSAEWKELAALDVGAASFQAKYEKLMLGWLAPPAVATTVMATVKLLSTHAEDEQYLSAGVERQDWLPLDADAELKAIFLKFLAAVQAIDAQVDSRNAAGTSLARTPEDGGLPYTLLRPTSEQPGVTFRGVPYSISI